MTRFIVSLSDEQRAKLENIRKFRGLRSCNQVVCDLIDEAEDGGLSAGITMQSISFEDRQKLMSNLPIAPRAEVERMMEGANPVKVVEELPGGLGKERMTAVRVGRSHSDGPPKSALQVGPVKRKPGSLAKKGK